MGLRKSTQDKTIFKIGPISSPVFNGNANRRSERPVLWLAFRQHVPETVNYANEVP